QTGDLPPILVFGQIGNGINGLDNGLQSFGRYTTRINHDLGFCCQRSMAPTKQTTCKRQRAPEFHHQVYLRATTLGISADISRGKFATIAETSRATSRYKPAAAPSG